MPILGWGAEMAPGKSQDFSVPGQRFEIFPNSPGPTIEAPTAGLAPPFPKCHVSPTMVKALPSPP